MKEAMARGRNSKSEKEESAAGSLEVGMLCKSAFSDSELESYLRQGEIKASEKPPVPPQVLWVGDCTIATFGNFSASTGKAKSKKTFNITAMVAAALTNSTVLNYRASFQKERDKFSISIPSRVAIIATMLLSESTDWQGSALTRKTNASNSMD